MTPSAQSADACTSIEYSGATVSEPSLTMTGKSPATLDLFCAIFAIGASVPDFDPIQSSAKGIAGPVLPKVFAKARTRAATSTFLKLKTLIAP